MRGVDKNLSFGLAISGACAHRRLEKSQLTRKLKIYSGKDLGQFKKCECELVAFLKARGLPTTDNLTCSVISLILAIYTFQQLSFPMHLHQVSSEYTLVRSGIYRVLTHMMFPLIMNLALVCIKRNFLASLIIHSHHIWMSTPKYFTPETTGFGPLRESGSWLVAAPTRPRLCSLSYCRIPTKPRYPFPSKTYSCHCRTMSADPSMEHLNPFTSKNEMPVRVRPTLARSLARSSASSDRRHRSGGTRPSTEIWISWRGLIGSRRERQARRSKRAASAVHRAPVLFSHESKGGS